MSICYCRLICVCMCIYVYMYMYMYMHRYTYNPPSTKRHSSSLPSSQSSQDARRHSCFADASPCTNPPFTKRERLKYLALISNIRVRTFSLPLSLSPSLPLSLSLRLAPSLSLSPSPALPLPAHLGDLMRLLVRTKVHVSLS